MGRQKFIENRLMNAEHCFGICGHITTPHQTRLATILASVSDRIKVGILKPVGPAPIVVATIIKIAFQDFFIKLGNHLCLIFNKVIAAEKATSTVKVHMPVAAISQKVAVVELHASGDPRKIVGLSVIVGQAVIDFGGPLALFGEDIF